MDKNKITGSYYTPDILVKAMVDYINAKPGDIILEPSAGDGRIVEEINKYIDTEIDVIEYINEKIDNLKLKFNNKKNIKIINKDFLDYSNKCAKKYDLIIGNPPYINKKYLSEIQKEKIKDIYIKSGIKFSYFSNIWNAFLLESIKLIKNNGVIFFVLPTEFLQVKHSESLRKYIIEKFQNIEIFVFKEKVYKNLSQSICLLLISNKNHMKEKGKKSKIKYKIMDSYDLKKPYNENKIIKNDIEEKWSNFILDESELALINRISEKYMTINEFGDISPGVVTGANNYFIVSDEFVNNNKIHKYVKPIISKSAYVRNCLILDREKYKNISKRNNCNLIFLNKFDENNILLCIKEYLKFGEKEGINKRFKCSKRNPWYNMPNITMGDVIFFKRYDTIPRILINKMNCYTSDLGYNIRLKEKYDPNSFVFSFFNSLTLLLCEVRGRYYGGGIQELTPQEFKSLHMPYKKIHHTRIKKLNRMIEEKVELDLILDYVDEIILSDIISKEEIDILRNIRNRYIIRRKGSY